MLDALDIAINAAFAPWRQGLLLAGFAWLTDMASESSAVAVALVASALLWSGGRAARVGPLWLTLTGAEATTWTLKFAAGRLRPPHLDGIEAASASFPSGHATVAVALFGYLALVVAADAPRHRRAVLACAGIWIALIGFSRMFLSLHYLTDVLAGYAIAAAWLWFGWRISARRVARAG